METRGALKRKVSRGRKKRVSNRQAETMDDHETGSRSVADETGSHNMDIVPVVSPKVENENDSRHVEAGGYNDDTDMAAIENTAVPKNESEDTDVFSDYFSRSILMTPYHAMDGTTTEQILEEADILLAEFRNASQSRSEIMNGIMEHGSSTITTSANDAPIEILDSLPIDASDHSSDSGGVTLVETANTATIASANAVDDSVVFVQDDSILTLPIPREADINTTTDDDVIFVDDYIPAQRITAVVNLCSPESSTSNRRKRQHSPAPRYRDVPELSESMNETLLVQAVKCPVCMEKITKGPPHSTICGHIFCGDCIKRAIQARKKCPICNKNLTVKGIHPLYFT